MWPFFAWTISTPIHSIQILQSQLVVFLGTIKKTQPMRTETTMSQLYMAMSGLVSVSIVIKIHYCDDNCWRYGV